eukprot:Cvel_13043.t2-p1 / transcript=Cvel_13043.t2 / gene=Cvel_13043 / organism=Chromera_velia_CCMP2878 / gene_product=hypothetical protein / transcript_product=hypothetical protein / location=Cvel_scaffold876:33899-34636(+) / protein_length=246 / sequence_SO=supercontig / SO=protein_coding / is_pseudo=false
MPEEESWAIVNQLAMGRDHGGKFGTTATADGFQGSNTQKDGRDKERRRPWTDPSPFFPPPRSIEASSGPSTSDPHDPTPKDSNAAGHLKEEKEKLAEDEIPSERPEDLGISSSPSNRLGGRFEWRLLQIWKKREEQEEENEKDVETADAQRKEQDQQTARDGGEMRKNRNGFGRRLTTSFSSSVSSVGSAMGRGGAFVSRVGRSFMERARSLGRSLRPSPSPALSPGPPGIDEARAGRQETMGEVA